MAVISALAPLLAVSTGRAIRFVDVDHPRRRWKLRDPGSGYDSQPSFSADGRRLVFCHTRYSRGNRTDVFAILLDGGGVQRLTDTGEEKFFPELSPGGRHLAFLRRHGRSFDLVTMRVGGSVERAMVRVNSLQSRPDFSPDGKSLVFAAKGHIGRRGTSEKPNTHSLRARNT